MHIHVVRLVYLIDVPFGNKVLSISKILIHRIQRWIGDGKEAELEREVRRMSRAVTLPPSSTLALSVLTSLTMQDKLACFDAQYGNVCAARSPYSSM